MPINNSEAEKAHILQNQFTAYLVTAVRRKKNRYLQAKIQLLQCEVSAELSDYFQELQFEQDMLAGLPVIEQLESQKLQRALKQSKERNLHIFLMKALEGRSYEEIAEELGIGYKAVTSAYARMLERLRKEIGGDES